MFCCLIIMGIISFTLLQNKKKMFHLWHTDIAVFSLCLTIHPDIVKGSHWILTWDIKNRKGMIMFWSVVPFYRHNWKASGCVAWKRSEFKRADKELSTNIPFWWSLCNELPHFACSHKEKLKHQNSSVDFNSKRFLLCLKKRRLCSWDLVLFF